ncbi:hypothetical protein TW95_gp1247 [Pandoravirus inopinatum]|uniref:Uncharacterized protein n=1 Tax=Pandoravirus inopinatum TaxID=1605721 RepID=A0A0B5JAK6_9VIRU|nr:hypothetical protein TW95_gp1247 [Pandoravirus inopinatum]AJF97981.1 hypothetical protein [Pandoravirus inopinatum]
MGSDANRGHAGTVGRRRRHRRTAAAPHARGPNMVGTMAIMALLAVVIIMVVIYLVRRLANAERAIKRTMAEVRHQVTPDDLHTAFGQWVEANPGAVTTACAPYINRSVAVAASAMRVHAPAPPPRTILGCGDLKWHHRVSSRPRNHTAPHPQAAAALCAPTAIAALPAPWPTGWVCACAPSADRHRAPAAPAAAGTVAPSTATATRSDRPACRHPRTVEQWPCF